MVVNKKIHAQPGFPTRCIFCGSDAPLTEEDYWPKWLRKYLSSPFKKSIHLSTWESDPSFEYGHLGRARIDKHRGPLNTPMKLVCASCNNGWMSRIQKSVSPQLKPLINGDWKDFDFTSQRLVSAWAVMFTMVYDFVEMKTQNITFSERNILKKNSIPPANWIVSIGFLRHPFAHGRVWKRSGAILDLETNTIPETCDHQTTTIGVGRLLIHTFSSTGIAAVTTDEIRTDLGLEVIWPSSHRAIQKPYRKISSGAGFLFVAKGAHFLIEDKLSQFLPDSANAP